MSHWTPIELEKLDLTMTHLVFSRKKKRKTGRDYLPAPLEMIEPARKR